MACRSHSRKAGLGYQIHGNTKLAARVRNFLSGDDRASYERLAGYVSQRVERDRKLREIFVKVRPMLSEVTALNHAGERHRRILWIRGAPAACESVRAKETSPVPAETCCTDHVLLAGLPSQALIPPLRACERGHKLRFLST